MKKFRFRLERVLQYRLGIKSEKQRDLIREQTVLHEQRMRLAGLEEELAAVALSEGSISSVEAIQLLGSYADRVRSQIEAQRVEIEKSLIRVEEARVVFQQASQEAEALEKLRARKQDEFQVRVAKGEEQFLDELSVMRAGRKSKEKR